MWLLINNINEKMRDAIIIMQKQRACAKIIYWNHSTTAFDQNNSFLSVKFKVQLRSSRNCLHQSAYGISRLSATVLVLPVHVLLVRVLLVQSSPVQSTKYLMPHQSVSESLSMKCKSSFARFNDGRGLAVEVEWNSAVSEGIHQILRL